MKTVKQLAGALKVKSIFIQIVALLAFLTINFVSYSAFSFESAIRTTFENQNTRVPQCEIAAEGLVDNHWKNIRIKINGALISGAETVSDLSQQIKQLVIEDKCLPQAVPCSFATEGVAAGTWVKHRILIQDIIAFGSDTTGRLFDQISELKKIGVCSEEYE